MNLTDQYGRIPAQIDYDDWGKVTAYQSLNISGGYRTVLPEITYAGHQYDDVLGMYYAKARMYDAENRRFASVKGRITEPMTLVQYLYVVDNPLRWVDPLGLIPWNNIGSFLHDAISDARGREILMHWLWGNGKEIALYNDVDWSNYMTKNESLLSQIQELVKGYCEQVGCGDSQEFDEILWPFSIDNGEQMIGYQYLHGVNSDVGGFRIQGSIEKDDTGKATIKFTSINEQIQEMTKAARQR